MKYIYSIFVLLLLASCNKDLDYRPDLIADAGSELINIANEGYKVSLAATPLKSGQTGKWSAFHGNNGVFADPTSPTSEFSGEPGETYLLHWEITDGVETRHDETSVSFKEMKPVFYMEIPDTLDNMYLQMYGSLPLYGATCKWEIIDGVGGIIENPESHEASLWGEPNETYKVRYSHLYGDAKESVEFKVTLDEFQAFAGADRKYANSSEYGDMYISSLWATLPYGAKGTWDIIQGADAEVINANDPNSLFRGNVGQEYKLKWTVEYKDYVDADTVTFQLQNQWGWFVDTRDNNGYRTVKIDDLEWMADNFRYKGVNADYQIEGNWYYGLAPYCEIRSDWKGGIVDTPEEREKYGRLYTLAHANAYAPPGWRLPTEEEWNKLCTKYGGLNYAGIELREGGASGLDLTYAGFHAPQGLGSYFDQIEEVGTFWIYAEVTEESRYENYIQVYPRSQNEETKEWYDNGTVSVQPTIVWYALSVRYVRDIN